MDIILFFEWEILYNAQICDIVRYYCCEDNAAYCLFVVDWYIIGRKNISVRR